MDSRSGIGTRKTAGTDRATRKECDMTRSLTRRRFLAAMAGASASIRPVIGGADETPKPAKTLDIHVHLFGTGDSGSGCRLSKTTTDGQVFKLLSAYLRLADRAKTKDEA